MIYIINGPNINLLGNREPQLYGNRTYHDIMSELATYAKNRGANIDIFQSNHEGAIIDYLQKLQPHTKVIINAAALTHTSIGIRDAIVATGVDAIEVHVSNIYNREDFRQKSYLSAVCRGSICGLGTQSYKLALDYFINTKP